MTADPSSSPTTADVRRYRCNLQEEVDGQTLYLLLAEAEDDPNLKTVFERLAESEKRHIDLWEEKLREAGAEVPEFRPGTQVRILGFLARRFGTQFVTPLVERMELNAVTMYDDQPEAIAEGLPGSERSHARLFQELGRPAGAWMLPASRVGTVAPPATPCALPSSAPTTASSPTSAS